MRYFEDTQAFVCSKAVFCGIDMHHKHWNLCLWCDGQVVEKLRIEADWAKLMKLFKNYATARHIHVVYEAGFCGFWLCRQLQAQGYLCTVTPPSTIPKSTSKVKTDKRDAETLASYVAASLLKAVYVPPPEIEADRRVNRRREQLRTKLTRDKNQIKSFLHLHGLTTPDDIRAKWSHAYLAWLAALMWSHPADAFTMGSLLRSYQRDREEVAAVTKHLRQLARTPRYEANFKRLVARRRPDYRHDLLVGSS